MTFWNSIEEAEYFNTAGMKVTFQKILVIVYHPLEDILIEEKLQNGNNECG